MAKKATAKKETQESQQPETPMSETLPATYAPSIVAPIIGSQEVVVALRNYQDLQKALDKSMPDQLIDIRGRQFRKKGYWRAIRTAFNLNLECAKEERIEVNSEHGPDWGYIVTYRAMAPNGAIADGDGCCMASEKTDRQGKIIATEHNVRSHAHTRAFNRAVSNLVGFGEVSAEEVDHEYDQRPQPTRTASAWGQSQPSQPQQQDKPKEVYGLAGLSKYHVELKQWIEDFVRDNELGESDKADILRELTAFQPKSGGKPFPGIFNFNFADPSFTEKLAMMAHHNFKERKEAAEAELAKRKNK